MKIDIFSESLGIEVKNILEQRELHQRNRVQVIGTSWRSSIYIISWLYIVFLCAYIFEFMQEGKDFRRGVLDFLGR